MVKPTPGLASWAIVTNINPLEAVHTRQQHNTSPKENRLSPVSSSVGFVVLLAAILSFMIGGGPGCSRNDDNEIVFWAFGAEGEHMEALIPEFERENPGVRVRLQTIPWTAAHEKVLTAYAGSSTPDVCQWGNTWIPELVLLKAIEPLDERVKGSTSIQRDLYFPGIWETNRMDSVLYGIPWYVDTRVLFYRKDLMARAGYPEPPRTWDEWRRVSEAIVGEQRGGERYAMLLPTSEWAPPVIMGLQTGASFLKARDTEGDFSNPAFSKAFGFYISFFRDGLAPIGLTRVQNLYQSMAEGVFCMFITGPWNIGEFRRRMPDSLQDQWMTAPLPSPDSSFPGASLAGGSSLVLFRNSAHKQEAWKLIEFLSRTRQQVAFYHETGDLPARMEAWQDSALASNIYIEAFRTQLERVVPTPRIPEWEQIAMKVQDYAELAARGRLSVTDALTALDRDADNILEKRRWMVNNGR